MKKILLLGAAALMSVVSASAAVYITGAGTTPSWSPGSPQELTLENGKYTFTLTGNFKISTEKGTWDQFNAGAKFVQGGWSTSGNTATGTLANGDSDINSPAIGKSVTYEVNEALTSITATWEGEVAAQDFYLIGPAVGGWNLKDAANKMTRDGNVYTITKSSLNGEWKINNGTWDLGFGQGEATNSPTVGVPYNVSKDGGAANLKSAITSEVTITFTYEANGQSTVLLTTDGDDPNPPTPPTPDPEYKDLYLVGDTPGWSVNEAYKFSREENVYTLTLPEALTGKWKIWDGSWAYNFGAGAAQPVAGEEYDTWFDGGDFTAAFNAGSVMQLTLVAGSDSKGSSTPSKLLITDNGDDPNPPTPPTPDPEYKDLYLVGNTPGWTEINEAYKFTREGNVYTLTLPEAIIGSWKIWDGTWDYNFGAGAAQPVAGEEAEAWFDGGDFTTAINKDGVITFTLVAGSDKKNSSISSTILITDNGDEPNPPTPPTPDPEYKDLYLVGNTPGWTEINEAYKFTREENVYTLTLPETIIGSWKIWDGTWDYNFGAGAEQPVFGVAYETWFDGGDFNVGIDKGGVIQLTLVAGSDKKNSSTPSQLMITGTTGVNSIEAVEGEVVYYNLQGARVLNPANGVFVRVANGKAIKVVK